MAKSKRLIEIMMSINKKKSFNAKELVNEFGVSTRTIVRDMQELIALGVPFYSAMELYVELTATGVQRCESELWPAHKMQIHVREDGTGWLGNQIPASSLPFFGQFFIG